MYSIIHHTTSLGCRWYQWTCHRYLVGLTAGGVHRGQMAWAYLVALLVTSRGLQVSTYSVIHHTTGTAIDVVGVMGQFTYICTSFCVWLCEYQEDLENFPPNKFLDS